STFTRACSISLTARTKRRSGFRRSGAAASWGFALLQVDNVSFAYGPARSRHFVLDAVSFEVRRGTILGVLGPNGSGKTTLLRLMAGTLAPLGGRVMLDGRDVGRLSRRDLARKVAVVPQETH